MLASYKGSHQRETHSQFLEHWDDSVAVAASGFGLFWKFVHPQTVAVSRILIFSWEIIDALLSC
jgi:hypothetical protein